MHRYTQIFICSATFGLPPAYEEHNAHAARVGPLNDDAKQDACPICYPTYNRPPGLAHATASSTLALFAACPLTPFALPFGDVSNDGMC